MVFTNPLKLNRCVFYYEMEIRDGRIRRWNNNLTDLPESSCALIPSILCCKVISFLNNQKGKTIHGKYERENLEQKLLKKSWDLPMTDLLGWYPDQDCRNDQLLGSLELKFEDGDILIFPLHRSLYGSLSQNLTDKVVYNWSIQPTREKQEQDLLAFDKLFHDTMFLMTREQHDELSKKWSTLQEVKGQSEHLSNDIVNLETGYGNAYDRYKDAYNLNADLIIKKDSINNHIASLRWSTNMILKEITFLSDYVDSLRIATNKLQTTIEELDEENNALIEIRNKLQKELGVKELAFMVVPPLIALGDSTMTRLELKLELERFTTLTDIPSSLVARRLSSHAALVLSEGFRPHDVSQNVKVDTSLIIRTIRRGENELIALLDIDILLTNRFNQRLREYSKKMLEEIGKIEAEKEQLNEENHTLLDSLAQLRQRAKFWSSKFDSTRSELEIVQSKVEEMIIEYNNLMDKYKAKFTDHVALLGKVRKLYLQKVKSELENR